MGDMKQQVGTRVWEAKWLKGRNSLRASFDPFFPSISVLGCCECQFWLCEPINILVNYDAIAATNRYNVATNVCRASTDNK